MEKQKRSKEETLECYFDNSKNNNPKATEYLVEYIEDNNFIYTTKNDERSEMWIYKEGIYTPEGKCEVKEQLRKLLTTYYSDLIANKVISKIETDTFIEQNKFFRINYPEEIPLNNGIINIFTKELLPFTPTKVFFSKIPIEYDPNKDCPNISNFLQETITPERESLIYQIIGYSLLKEYRIEKAFMFNGNGRNGKSIIISIIKNFLGSENCSAIPFSSLSENNFDASELFGKLVNISGEISSSVLKEVSTFKTLTGRDFVSVRRKFKTMMSFTNYAKLIFASNELPLYYDDDLAFWERWTLLDFPYTFLDSSEYNKKQKELSSNPKEASKFKIRDERIIEKLITPEELSGLLNRSLQALESLNKDRVFNSAYTTETLRIAWIKKSNSFMAFCLENITSMEGSKISKPSLRQIYSKYCKLYELKSRSDELIKVTLENEYQVEDIQSSPSGEFLGMRFWTNIAWTGDKMPNYKISDSNHQPYS